MKIVASNSLTLSKVNDGTLTHTAWSYSADGTDRFTTVYPNLNLLTNSRLLTSNTYYAPWESNNSTLKIIQNGLNISSQNISKWRDTGTVQRNIPFSVGKPITISCWVTNNSENSISSFKLQFRFDNPSGITFPSKIFPTVLLKGNRTKFEYTYTVPLNTTMVSAYFQVNSLADNSSFDFDLIDMKVEESSTATPWMPSASEVTTADWPKYIGHYTDFMQADSTNPSDYTWGPMRGDDGVGVTSTVITYANSTSGTTAPSTGWTSSIPSPVKGQYLWTKTVWTSTDTSSKTAYSVSYNSKDGTNGTNGTSGIIVSSVAPESPQTGQLWQDTSTTPQLVKKWTGSSWVIWEFYAQNLKADSLETISAKIGKVYNEFEYEATGSLNKGSIMIENDIQFTTESITNVNHPKANIMLSTNTNFTGLMVQYLPINDASGGHQTAYYTYGGIYMQDNINNWNGQITAENVTYVPWKNLILNSGYTAGDGVQPQYRRIKNLDGSYTVQFRGAVSPTSGNFPTAQVQIATLSGVYLPPTTSIRQSSDNTGRGARVAMTTSGNLHILAPNTSSYVYLEALTYVN